MSLYKRSRRCRYLDHITKPNSTLCGCGIPGISTYSETIQKLGGSRVGKVLIGVGALAGMFFVPMTFPVITVGAAVSMVAGALGSQLMILAYGNEPAYGKSSMELIRTANKTAQAKLEANHATLLGLASKAIAEAPEEAVEAVDSIQTRKGGLRRKNRTQRK